MVLPLLSAIRSRIGFSAIAADPPTDPPAPPSPASPSPLTTVKHVVGPCTFVSQSKRLPCDCHEGSWITDIGPLDDFPICRECGHLISLHQQYSTSTIQTPSPPTWLLSNEICRREHTITGLLNLVLQQRVVQVRGTPTSGKTTMSQLLHDYIKSTILHLIPVYIVWQEPTPAILASNQQFVRFNNWLHALAQLPDDFMSRNDVVLIIDEAQLSYTNSSFWLQCVKPQAEPGRSIGPYVVLFSSYGSADSTALNIEGSASITLEQRQRVSLTPQPQIQHEISLRFTETELRDICIRITNGFQIGQDLVDHLFHWTNGHPGLCYGLLKSIIEIPEIKHLAKAGQVIHRKHVQTFFDSDSAIFRCIEERIRRSLPTTKTLNDSEFPNIRDALRAAIVNDGIKAEKLRDVPGLLYAYKKGYLQAEMIEEGLTAYSFPSLLHRRYCASLILPNNCERFPFNTVKDLCFEAIRNFSPEYLQDHLRMAQHLATKYVPSQQAQPPEAQYGSELYRCLYKVTNGKGIVDVEFSYTESGRLDYFVRGKSWGIELLRDGNGLQEHLDRFKEKGKYGSWDLVEDWIMLDFRQSEPNSKTKRNDPHLFKIILAPNNESVRIWDSNHNEVMPLTQLFYR